ncbi:hypothetical protein MMC06_000906 [Schaereria dolodes]|nr:hypothetical protein [Schaereria dolodes]
MTTVYRRYLIPALIVLLIVLFWQWNGPPTLENLKTYSFSSVAELSDIPPAIQHNVPSADSALALVVASQSTVDVSWILPDQLDMDIDVARYVTDLPNATFHIPANKGHEAMVYLTYIISNYYKLPEISVFTHHDRYTWHNNGLLNNDLTKMLKRLNPDKVKRDGYFSLRCHLMPGCWLASGEGPDNLQLNRSEINPHKPEEVIFKDVWPQLHPSDPLPATLSHPCCAQFALSREKILEIPLERYVAWREWLLQTDLDDHVSGRVWEYTWHYIFTGQADYCPSPHICYCDGYGVCFESEEDSADWFRRSEEKSVLERELEMWRKEQEERIRAGKEVNWRMGEEYEERIECMRWELDKRRDVALERGLDPGRRERALGLKS